MDRKCSGFFRRKYGMERKYSHINPKNSGFLRSFLGDDRKCKIFFGKYSSSLEVFAVNLRKPPNMFGKPPTLCRKKSILFGKSAYLARKPPNMFGKPLPIDRKCSGSEVKVFFAFCEVLSFFSFRDASGRRKSTP